MENSNAHSSSCCRSKSFSSHLYSLDLRIESSQARASAEFLGSCTLVAQRADLSKQRSREPSLLSVQAAGRCGEPPSCQGWCKFYVQRSRESSDSDRTRETLTFVNERTCCGYAIARLSLKRKTVATAAVTSARTRAAISRHSHWRRACVAQRDTWCAHPLV